MARPRRRQILADLPTINICTAYRHQGKTLTHFPGSAEVLQEVEPIYETCPGFEGPIDNCRSFADLPAQAKAYVQRIEAFINVPVRIISVGPRRDQTLIR
jgi:adenylosuccinate synthase